MRTGIAIQGDMVPALLSAYRGATRAGAFLFACKWLTCTQGPTTAPEPLDRCAIALLTLLTIACASIP